MDPSELLIYHSSVATVENGRSNEGMIVFLDSFSRNKAQSESLDVCLDEIDMIREGYLSFWAV